MKNMIVIFKTHLDIGFTDFSGTVIHNYIYNFIPRALELARQTREQKHRFIWTTGSWLIDAYFREATPEMRRAMEDAIAHGDIAWHALPCTTHTEVMTRELFRFGLQISQNLDRQYGIHTIGAKMTDVPGHTRAMIPELARAGVKFLHIGVNPASTPPDVPSLFRWRWDSGEEILVMYNAAYGVYTEIPGTDTAVYFAHTNDNCGPQNAEDIEKLYAQLEQQYPGTSIRAGTLNDVARAMMQAKGLPVVTREIGDSWIHGAGTDPEKVRQYRTLLRACRSLPREVTDPVYRELLLVPEHTWGLDAKIHLGDWFHTLSGEHRYYIRSQFEAARPTARFQKMEQSWQEQRDYVRRAAKLLEEKTGVSHLLPPPAFPRLQGLPLLNPAEEQILGGFRLRLDENGAICYLTWRDRVLADNAHPLAGLLYETFSADTVKQFKADYLSDRPDWALEDFGKMGMEAAGVPQQLTAPRLAELRGDAHQITVLLTFDGDCHSLYGAPAQAALVMSPDGEDLNLTLFWTHKPANRLPEALWLSFLPFGSKYQVSKLGLWLDPTQVVNNGGRRLMATDQGIRNECMALDTLDAVLVNLGDPALYRFRNDPVPTDRGFCINLYNNAWGTNFPMWYDEDASFRFCLHFS